LTRRAALMIAAITVAWAPVAGRAQAAAEASIPAPPDTLSANTLDFLFQNPEHHPVVHLDAAAIDSVGTAMSTRNMVLLGNVNDEYQRGTYGSPGSDDARRDALAAYVFHAETGFDFFVGLSTQDSVIFSTSEKDLERAFTERFRNPGLYPVVNLVDARTGFGHFGLQFEVDDPTKREIEVSHDKMRAWTEEIEWQGEKFRVVNIDMKTISNDRVHVVYRKLSCGQVHVYDVDQNGTPIRVVALEDLAGQYVRKFGFHRPAAMVVWRTRVDGLVPPPLEGRFLGSAVYFPALALHLPWFLPSLGFEDLRRFDFPEPILTMDAVAELRRRNYDWIRLGDDLRFEDWEGEGPIPTFVDAHFPDK
jgi:hypothetical protein